MKSMQLMVIALIAEVALEWSPAPYESRGMPMVWIDGRYRTDIPIEIDTLFDRMVSIAFANRSNENRTFSHEGTGVFITTELILTSFNAFRDISSQWDKLKDMEIFWFTGRKVDPTGRTMIYTHTGHHHMICARQVVPSPAYNTWPDHMRHGPHTPLHDLMVLRSETPAVFVTPVPPVVYDFPDYKTWVFVNNLYSGENNSPIRTILAKPGDVPYEDEMKFASIAHLNDRHIKENRWLEVGHFGAMVDCDEWIPREWGHFICLQNTKNYPGLGSGAMLFSDTTLFGVGAFLLRKESSSILVFTDVRPYWDLLHRTCTEDDQELREPKD